MIQRTSKLLISLLISALLLTGCWDYTDINMMCITVSIGVDSIDGNIEFSGEIAKIISPTDVPKEQNQASGVYNLLSYGKTFEEARINYNTINPFPVFLGATRVVVFGENYAKQGIEAYLHRIDSLYDYRKTLLTAVSRERPKELFEKKVEKELSVGFLIEDILTHLEENGQALYPKVGELLSDISFGKIGYLLPYIGIENNSIKYLGMVVMKDSKMVDILKVKDTSGLLYLLSKNPSLVETIPSTNHEGNFLSFRTKIKKRKVKTDYIDEKVIINIDLNLTSELQYQHYMDLLSDQDIKKYEAIISKRVRNSVISIIEKSQKDFKCDIFRFAKIFKGQHPKIYEQIDWKEAFPNAEINVDVKTKIVNTTLSDTTAKKKY
ncbi:Ger(x)C family spore germination protein [Paramaledivibacter caminithermalis]|jgi:spore germination protein KC|uniref:Germination protein, Ger(X)C family n=1 Tax=Paramaledivibacter caminithermalis (strain DSM 15212 / CIP 107654 / DViRD3) TaxID=1121301 RepID=A0A1M6LRQ4_PARC5|nr:Ger(x)C family spore germination protein [Paramaledivibacter caminithermalis]SHJ73860.1 germination protein, Ger(x)C family [Paramaledivibacter caminithermalis DSM 15212]